ncbi:MAG: glutamine-hydrolyzing carbamoyl-phosphate synthase small subunit [Bacillota bacterium]
MGGKEPVSAVLWLEDGTVFKGRSFGFSGRKRGEVVFSTGMTGYLEAITDPSFAGQILTMTYPLIGNYGVNPEDSQSAKPYIRGLVVRDFCPRPSNWRSTETLADYLVRNQVIAIAGVDTRALTRHLRIRGTMGGIISTEQEDVNNPAQLAEYWKEGPSREMNLVSSVTTPQVYHVPGSGPRVAILDLGMKKRFLDILTKMNCECFVLPAKAQAGEVLALSPQGVLISNGPGDPKDVPQTIKTVAALAGKVPLFGVCLGHQALALALGGDTYKLKFGHRGVNHPVKDLATGRVYITSQNHGYAVREEALPSCFAVSHRNLNDGTVEGLRHLGLPIRSVQFHPEAGPGPEDSSHILREFVCSIM